MTINDFNEVVKKQMSLCSSLLLTKGEEYAPDAMEKSANDRLLHFKKAAAIMGATPKVALLGMFSKHIVSVSDMCTDNKNYSIEKWTEKITDSINYLLILRALVEEEEKHEQH